MTGGRPVPPVLAEVVRSGLVESRHRGSLVALSPDGTPKLWLGEPEAPVFPRSANKPPQAVGMVEAGFAARDARLAIAAASHSGQPCHIGLVREVLASAGLAETALGNTAGLPLDDEAAQALLRAGGGADRLHHNCSGKHAAMLATCVVAGWPTEGYLAADHPLQRQLRDTVARLGDEPVAAVGVDGCGAPLFAISLLALARIFQHLATAAPGTPAGRVAGAMRAHPAVVGGTGRDVTALMAAVPGLLAKDGAEGVYAAATSGGAAVALKIEDGAARARLPVLVAALRGLGVDGAALAPLATVTVLGGPAVVGEVRVTGVTQAAG